MTQENLKNQFHEETGLYYYRTDIEDFKWNDDYVEWLENKLIQSQSKFHGYCKQETKDKGRCKDICNKPECGW
jgi:hypothetical protein